MLSRFRWGLSADLQIPDYETRIEILERKMKIDGLEMPKEVVKYIAYNINSNIRELEGALVKLMAYTSLTGAPITLTMAQQVLKHLALAQDRRVTIDTVQKAVAERFGIRQVQLKEKSNTKTIVYPRQVAMYLVKELTSASLPEIGRAFGGKHHTTVIHSISRINQLRQTDPHLNRTIHSLIESLQ